MFSSTVHAPSLVFMNDHTLSGLYRSSFVHLHQMQAWLCVALSIPVVVARNFQSPPMDTKFCAIYLNGE